MRQTNVNIYQNLRPVHKNLLKIIPPLALFRKFDETLTQIFLTSALDCCCVTSPIRPVSDDYASP